MWQPGEVKCSLTQGFFFVNIEVKHSVYYQIIVQIICEFDPSSEYLYMNRKLITSSWCCYKAQWTTSSFYSSSIWSQDRFKLHHTLWPPRPSHCRMVVLETRQAGEQSGLSNLYVLEVAENYVMLPWFSCLLALCASPDSTECPCECLYPGLSSFIRNFG